MLDVGRSTFSPPQAPDDVRMRSVNSLRRLRRGLNVERPTSNVQRPTSNMGGQRRRFRGRRAAQSL